MSEVVSGSAVEIIEYEKQLQDLASDIAALQSEHQNDINQLTETLLQIGENLGSKIDALVQATDLHTQEIVEALTVLQQNDGAMYEAVILIAGILVFCVVCLLFWGIYKFLRIFF